MTDYRNDFDAALRKWRAGDLAGALTGFTAVTAADPSVSDAWLGRIAAGDLTVDTLAAACANLGFLYRETRRLEWDDGELCGRIECPKYVMMPVNSPPMITLAYACALLAGGEFPHASAVLADPSLSAPPAAQWQHFLQTCLFYVTERWPDVLTTAAAPPNVSPQDFDPDLRAAVATMAGVAAVRLGRYQRALELLDSKTDRTTNPYIRADAALARGWALRALGRSEEARTHFEQAVIKGALMPAAASALADETQLLPVVTEDMIAARSDRWKVTTQPTSADLDAAERDKQRRQAGEDWRRRVDELIGHEEVKEQIAVWRTEIEIEQITAEQEGRPPEDLLAGHIVLEGPPGTGKTTWGRILTDILFELGMIKERKMIEVSEEDLVKGYVSQTPEFAKQKLEEALHGVFFLDEAPRLVPKTEGHSFGPQAIDTINKFMYDHAGDIVVIVAGYKTQMREFLKQNPGFASRFHLTFTFDGYGPAQVRQIGQLMAATKFKTPLAVADDAWPLLESEVTRLQVLPTFGNARYAEQVITHCRGERARRMKDLDHDALRVLASTGGLSVTADDMRRALERAARQYD